MKANWPKISIITPSFNQGKFIRQTIESVLNQNYPNLEYLVIDGGSSDETISILKSYGKKFYWISEKDAGQTDAINKGLIKATGEVIGYLNSDDLLLPGAVQRVAEEFRNKPELMWLSGDYYIINKHGKKIQAFTVWYKKILRTFPYLPILSIANFIAQPSTFWRKKLHDEVGVFDQSLHYCMDYDFWLRCLQKYPLHILTIPLSVFRIHQASKGGSQFNKQFAEEHSVLRRYRTNRIILLLHKLHVSAIVMVYKFIK